MTSAFFAGLGTAAILGPRILRGIPRPLAVFAVVSFLVGAVLFGIAEARATRQRNNEENEHRPDSQRGHQGQP